MIITLAVTWRDYAEGVGIADLSHRIFTLRNDVICAIGP